MDTDSSAGDSRETRPVALTIAGSDSGGGAGMQADLRAFAFFAVHGTAAVTAVTAQTPAAVTDVTPVPAAAVQRQMEAVLSAFHVGAVKTGVLFSAEIIRAVAAILAQHEALPLVVDPVMVATSGARLLQDDAVAVLCRDLLPRAAVITPNLPEAALICGTPLDSAAARAAAARELARRCRCIAVIKGGHADTDAAADWVSDGRQTWELSSPRVKARTTHGSGCSLSAAIAAGLAAGRDALTAIREAKAYVCGALRHVVKVGPETWAMAPPPQLDPDTVRCRAV